MAQIGTQQKPCGVTWTGLMCLPEMECSVCWSLRVSKAAPRGRMGRAPDAYAVGPVSRALSREGTRNIVHRFDPWGSAAIRTITRLECVGETLRAVLNHLVVVRSARIQAIHLSSGLIPGWHLPCGMTEPFLIFVYRREEDNVV